MSCRSLLKSVSTKHVGVVVVVIVITVVGAYSIRAHLYLVLRWQTVFAFFGYFVSFGCVRVLFTFGW